MTKKKLVMYVVQKKRSPSIPQYNHLLTNMARHASNKSLIVYVLIRESHYPMVHYPVAQATSDFHRLPLRSGA